LSVQNTTIEDPYIPPSSLSENGLLVIGG